MANGERNSPPSPGMGRRQFLKRAALTGVAAAGFPYIIPSRAFGAGENVAPSNRLNIGFIGMGTMNKGHLAQMWQTPDVQVVAVCDIESTRLEDCRRWTDEYYAKAYGSGNYKACLAYADFNELLARPDIDAVMIATPDHWHALPAIAAAKAGKDIYCEKPMAHTVEEGRAMVNAVRRYGRVFQTGSQQRSEFNGYFRRAAEMVRNGVIGDLKSIDIGVGPAARDSVGLPEEPVPPTMDWDRWLGPAPWRPYSSVLSPMNYTHFPDWRSFRDYAGGSLSDFGAHNFDIAQWALCMDDSGPVEFIHPNDSQDKEKRLTMQYANGIPMYHGGKDYCTFNGTKGIIHVSRDYLRTEPEGLVETPYSANDVRLDRGRGHHRDWLECIKTREKPIADVEIGHRTATICALANMCYQIGRSFKWDPKAERVVGDEEANRMLGYAYRAPYKLEA